MPFTLRIIVLFVASASAAFASVSTPLAMIGLDLVVPGNSTTAHTVEKRASSTIDGVLCGIGILSACAASTAVNTNVDTSNCASFKCVLWSQKWGMES